MTQTRYIIRQSAFGYHYVLDTQDGQLGTQLMHGTREQCERYVNGPILRGE